MASRGADSSRSDQSQPAVPIRSPHAVPFCNHASSFGLALSVWGDTPTRKNNMHKAAHSNLILLPEEGGVRGNCLAQDLENAVIQFSPAFFLEPLLRTLHGL